MSGIEMELMLGCPRTALKYGRNALRARIDRKRSMRRHSRSRNGSEWEDEGRGRVRAAVGQPAITRIQIVSG